MNDELILCPFERSIAGYRGTILRKNKPHAEQCVEAIQRRNHPAWSRFNCGFEIAA